MTFDFIGRLKLAVISFLQRQFHEAAQHPRDPDFRDDDRERSAREYEYNYWAVGSPWY